MMIEKGKNQKRDRRTTHHCIFKNVLKFEKVARLHILYNLN